MKFLVVGGGFAGRMLAWFLCKKGAEVTLSDRKDPYSATRVSAGIIKPVTGRRIVKTANGNEAIPIAFSTYRELAELTGMEILRNKPVLHLFNSPGNRNDWMARSSDPDMEGATGAFLNSNQISPAVSAPFGGVVLNDSGYVNPASFEKAIDQALKGKCEFLMSQGHHLSEQHEVDDIDSKLQLFDRIILCQGPLAVRNKLTSWIPFKPVKGEILDIEVEGLNIDYILSSGIYVVPYGDNLFRAGATYVWDDLSNTPTEQAAKELAGSLSHMIIPPFKILGQKAGIRPAIADRRPVIGWLPGNARIGIFNGLGTKGAMLGPYFANQAAEYFLSGKSLDADVDLIRYSKLYR
jgi:glycine/D-amino acid oxidase-like deaminating enzyme